MAIPSADLENGTIHVYAHSRHSDHPFLSAGQWILDFYGDFNASSTMGKIDG
jgi:hypothetical protein